MIDLGYRPQDDTPAVTIPADRLFMMGDNRDNSMDSRFPAMEGGGIGLVGNADVIVASDDAKFGLPEVERGALGAATHLSRLVPQHMMRRLFFTAATVDAATLHHFGSVHEVVPRAELDEAALRVARGIATKDTRVIRAAKEALNLIDPQRVNSSYRMEQGFTFELNLSGVSDELRDDFAGTKKAAT